MSPLHTLPAAAFAQRRRSPRWPASVRQFILVLVLAWVGWAPQPAQAEVPRTIDMKLLVIAATSDEPTLGGMRAMLDHVGVPYDTLIASQTSLVATQLSDGLGAGHYQGIVLTTGNLAYQDATGNWVSALSAAQWNMLWSYERDFRVRQATLYTYPLGQPDTYGLVLDSTAGSAPIDAQLTAAGTGVFDYLKPSAIVPIRNSWTYLARPVSSTNPVTLLSTADGYAIASVYTYTDGRQNLAITTDGNQYLTHTLLLGYGVVNWVSKGFFLGQRKVYMTPQPDDLMIADDLWDPATNTDTSGLEYRITGTDYDQLAAWQARLRQRDPNNAGFQLELPFNGVGASGIYPNDTLTRAIKRNPNAFAWISHTYDHALLDAISQTDAYTELSRNHQVAMNLRFQKYFKDSMIQPEISGLGNPAFLAAAAQFGIRYILSDASHAGWASPTPNTGFYSSYQPSILIIPRYATNLYYNVGTPQEWVSEYNWFYAPGGVTPYWDHALSYDEILDVESDHLLAYLLRFDVNPLMFHQTNLRLYDGVHTLLGDLVDRTLAKFNAYYRLPIVSPSQHEIGGIMAQRMAYNASGIRGTLVLTGSSPTITLSTSGSVNAPLTGVSWGRNVQKYGTQTISTVTLRNASTQANIPAPGW